MTQCKESTEIKPNTELCKEFLNNKIFNRKVEIENEFVKLCVNKLRSRHPELISKNHSKNS